MIATQREKTLYGDDIEVVSREDDCTIYRISDKTGDVVMTGYPVFEGIDLIYNDVHIQNCLMERECVGNVFEINHCREGRIECGFKDEFVYLEPGDMFISRKNNASHDSYFPTSHYHGITIMIDADKALECLSCFLDDVNVKPPALIQKFCDYSKCFVVRSADCFAYIFSKLYSVRDCIRTGYFKIKVLELLLFLSGMDIENENVEKRCYTKSQVELAKHTCKFIASHLSERIYNCSARKFISCIRNPIKELFQGCLWDVGLCLHPDTKNDGGFLFSEKHGLHHSRYRKSLWLR